MSSGFGKVGRYLARRLGLSISVLAILAAFLATYVLTRPTTLSVAVAPAGGTEPALMRAFADALEAEGKAGIRLRLVPFPGVRESAAALEEKRVDLAVVRPDIAMPRNGLTLAVLRELAALVVAPGEDVKELSDLGGKRLAVLSSRTADPELLASLFHHVGLELRTDLEGATVPPEACGLIAIDEADLVRALRDKRVDAVAVVSTPTTPAAQRIVGAVREAAADREVTLLALPDVPALVARFPRLQSVSIQAGLFGGDPKLPAEEVTTIGASHRLMARSTLSRSNAAEVTQRLFELRAGIAATVPAADDMLPPPYETTAEASARMPVHPGALDYFEREQESLIERYESWIYLVAILGGSVVSMFAWLRNRVRRIRRERIDVATGRLLKLRSQAARENDPEKLARMEEDVDAVAASIARHILRRPTDAPTIEAASIAVDSARSTIRRALDRSRTVRPETRPA